MIKINLWDLGKLFFTTQMGHLFLVCIFIAIVLFILIEFLESGHKKGYKYEIKDSVMSSAENEFYNLLLNIVQGQYFVFPQVHLETFLEHKISGQSWIGALRHINQKSVDFLICDLESRKPLLAIELDDRSHEREDRIERDQMVKYIFEGAHFPLLRFKCQREYNIEEIKQ
ncbi:MAG TPA: DUF2726 domain-containing protein, partial [Patescibacteria group bacterium]|nr:DUF2726 domain-containing protein [Patescibacteria group bacterium]